MNFDELQNIWNVSGNNLPSDRQRSLAEQFTRQMLRRRRFQTDWLASTSLALAVTTGIAIRAVALGKASLELEWALFPLLIVPWLFAFHFLRRHLNPASPMARGEVSVTDALRAALASNRAEQSHLKKVGLLFAIMI